MEIKAILCLFPVTFVYLASGLILNIIQAACFMIVRPISKSAYRKIVGVVTELLLWSIYTWLLDWWAGIEIHLFTDSETYKLMGKEHAILMANHISDVDIFIILLLAQHFDRLRSILLMMKKSSMYIPVHGWGTWFAECIFLSRNWTKDETVLKTSLKGLEDFPMPFWLTIFTEGTRITPDKLLASQRFAISRGLPVLKNVLIPRTKGFVTLVQHMRSFVPAIYDITLAVSRGRQTPSLLQVSKRLPTVVQIHIKRYSVNELPKSDEGIAEWCKDRFVIKDALLDEFHAKNTFQGHGIKNIVKRSIRSLVVFVSLCCLTLMGTLALIQRFSLLSTWQGISSIVGGLAINAIFVHAMLEYTKLPPQVSKI